MKKIIASCLFTSSLFFFFACNKANVEDSFTLEYVVKNASTKPISFVFLKGLTNKDTLAVAPSTTTTYRRLITSDGTPDTFFKKINVQSSIFVLTQVEKITKKSVDDINNWTLSETSAKPTWKVEATFEVTDSDF